MHAFETAQLSLATQLKWLARTSAEIIAVLWTGCFLAELAIMRQTAVPLTLAVQAAAVAAIFAGYVIGGRREQLGGWMTILATAAFIAAPALNGNWTLANLQLAWFALPGALYLLALHYEHQEAKRPIEYQI